MRIRAIFGVFLSAIGFQAAAGISDADRIWSYSGTARSIGTHEPLYGEQHFLRMNAGRILERVVLYTCRGGAPFARKDVTYDAPFAPDFELRDANAGLIEGLSTTDGRRRVYFKRNAGAAQSAKDVPAQAGLVADAGFDEFVKAHWAQLMSGEKQRFDFLVPSRLSVMSFQVRHARADRVDGTPVQVFRLSLSGILGWVLPGIDVYYSTADHVLLRYVGLSDIRDAAGDNYKAQIEFPLTERRSADPQSVALAKQAPLRPCA